VGEDGGFNFYLKKKSKTSELEFDFIQEQLLQKVKIVPRSEFEEFLARAARISPDPNDKPYFALALKLQAAIWSNDKQLKKQREIKVFSTKELYPLL